MVYNNNSNKLAMAPTVGSHEHEAIIYIRSYFNWIGGILFVHKVNSLHSNFCVSNLRSLKWSKYTKVCAHLKTSRLQKHTG